LVGAFRVIRYWDVRVTHLIENLAFLTIQDSIRVIGNTEPVLPMQLTKSRTLRAPHRHFSELLSQKKSLIISPGMSTSLDDLAAFLHEANLHTYASGKNKIESGQLGSVNFKYQKGPWSFRDSYYGDEKFLGQELISFHNCPVWGASYYGFVTTPSDKHEIYDFLKTALLKQSLSRMPVRGPERHRVEKWIYVNKASGTLASFMGEEYILHDKVHVYKGFYQGGLIQGKEA
jgi:Domain of unknown function (DUF5680)